jgi:hypothetical protein
MSEIEILTEFKSQLITFFDELVSQFPTEPDLIVLRLFLTNQVPIQDVMNIFNHKINTNDQELRKMVKERNEVFFLEHSIFENVQKDKVNHFKKLWRSGRLDLEDKNVIWNWMDAFIYLGDKYSKTIVCVNK